MKHDDLVVDGEVENTEKDRGGSKGRQFVAGLRLLRQYGRMADRVLRDIEAGKSISAELPFLERTNRDYKNNYHLSHVPVHREPPLPPLPSYEGISLRLEKLGPPKRNAFSPSPTKKEMEFASRSYALYAKGPAIGVHGGGRVREVASDEIVGHVWMTKKKAVWSLRSSSKSTSALDAVRKNLAESMASMLVKLCSEGRNEVWHSQAVHVHRVLRDRCRARLELDGHAERIRQEIVAILTVNDVHSL